MHVPWEPELTFVLSGKGRGLPASDLNLNFFLTYTVTYLLFLFHDFLTHHFDSHFLGLFCSWGGTDFTFVFIKDLEAETIHVCIAWALLKLSGMCFFFIVCLCVFFYWAFLVHRFIRRGMGDTRYSLLPCHGDKWLVGFGCERNHGMRSCSLFEIDILGVCFLWNLSRGNRPSALKMGFIIITGCPFLVVFILDHVFIFFYVAPDSLPLPSLFHVYGSSSDISTLFDKV